MRKAIAVPSREGRVIGIATCVLVALTWLTPVDVQARVRYEETGFDANDVSTRIDIRSSTRTVIQKQTGSRAVKIVVRGYDDWPAYPNGGEGFIKLDTRGGPFADAKLRFRVGTDSLCIFGKSGVSYDAYRVDGPDDWFSCRVPFSVLRQEGAKPNKEIRWKVNLQHDLGGPTDHAPNGGWYG